MHLFVNALAASAGGGLTYVRNVIPRLAASPAKITVVLPSGLRKEFGHSADSKFIELNLSAARRFLYEQSTLPQLISHSGADVLLSTGNFATRRSPVPQVLLSRNSIYTSHDYFHDLRRRHEFGMLADTYLRSLLVKKSIQWADVTVAPSESFAAELRRWTAAEVISIHHGFDRQEFTRSTRPLPDEVSAKLKSTEGTLRLLFVSHYNYYRNFETLIRALPILRDTLPNREVRLLLTSKLTAGENPGPYQPDSVLRLIKALNVSEMVVQLGTIAYEELHQIYRCADLYVTPAYTETFAHPLVEAMSSGVPVIASDIPVHREVCGDAAVYFDRFSPAALAGCISKIVGSPEQMSRMALSATQRSHLFSWKTHVEKILGLCERLVVQRRGR